MLAFDIAGTSWHGPVLRGASRFPFQPVQDRQVVIMAKPELGLKRVCVSCSARFYDLNRAPAICPKCGAEQPSDLPQPKRGGDIPADQTKKDPKNDEDDIDVDLDTDDDGDDDVMEDTSDLDDDDDDLGAEIEVSTDNDDNEN